MAAIKFSIQMDVEKKKMLEELAKVNYRSLNGEINMAIDFYMNSVQNGIAKVETNTYSMNNPPIRTEKNENDYKSNQSSIKTNDFDDEVEEF